MSHFLLPRGTDVKHGTTSGQLRSILNRGLQAGADRHELRERAEHAPEAEGIYVGDLMAYFGAAAAFGAAAVPCYTPRPDAIERDPDATLDQIVFPVVLRIELPEDCELWADEDFIPSPTGAALDYTPQLLRERAEPVWTYFRSGAIVREGGVPAGWIKSFEFPRFYIERPNRDLGNAHRREFIDDVRLMVWSHIQNWEKLSPEECWSRLWKMTGRKRTGFTQSVPFTPESVDAFFAQGAFATIERAFAHMASLHGAFTRIAEESGIGGLIR